MSNKRKPFRWRRARLLDSSFEANGVGGGRRGLAHDGFRAEVERERQRMSRAVCFIALPYLSSDYCRRRRMWD